MREPRPRSIANLTQFEGDQEWVVISGGKVSIFPMFRVIAEGQARILSRRTGRKTIVGKAHV
jgi:hypothetical protein